MYVTREEVREEARAMAATILWQSGAESGDAATEGVTFTATNASVAGFTSEHHRGNRAYYIEVLASGDHAYIQRSQATSLDTDYYARVYLQVAALPASGYVCVLELTGGPNLEALLDHTGALTFYNGAAAASVASSAITVSLYSWHRLEVHWRVPTGGGSTGTLEIRWDAQSVYSGVGTANVGGTAVSALRLGGDDNTAAGMTVEFDDAAWASGGTTGDWIGPVTPRDLYVAATGGNDSNDGLTPATAWATLANVATLSGGDTVHVASGTYVGPVEVDSDGISDEPILLTADAQYGAVITEPANADNTTTVLALRGAYVTADGFDVSGPHSATGVLLGKPHSTAQRCKVHHIANDASFSAGYGGAGISSFTSNEVSGDNHITQNLVYHVGPEDANGTIIAYAYTQGIYPSTDNTAGNNECVNNIVADCCDGGIALNHNPRGWLISNNTLLNCLGDGITLWSQESNGTYLSDENTVQNNLIYQCGTSYAIHSASDNNGAHNIFRTNLAWGTYDATYDNTPHSVNPPQDMTSLERPNADPLFRWGLLSGLGDYALVAGSPAINTGTSDQMPTVDFFGRPRTQPDVGAVAYQADAPAVSPLAISGVLQSVAKHLADLSALLGSTSALTAGQTTTQGRVAALGDFSQLYALLGGFNAFLANEDALLAQWQEAASAGAYQALLPLCVALERDTGGLNAYLTANSIKAPTLYATAHNACARLSDLVGTISGGNIDSTLTPTY